ncbi:WD40 repeat domain-containing protein [Frankia tisae]|nr:WD40 repeat domain-containing protein [Frankia tisae]
MTGRTEAVHGVAIAPDGRTVATAGYGRATRLWKLG